MNTKEMVTRFAGIKGYDDDEIINVLIGFIEYQMKEEELREFLQQGIDADEEEDELPCYREQEADGTWSCVNDHTGCLWNNGHNECGFDPDDPTCCPCEAEEVS